MVLVRVMIDAVVQIDVDELMYDTISSIIGNKCVDELEADGEVTITEE